MLGDSLSYFSNEIISDDNTHDAYFIYKVIKLKISEVRENLSNNLSNKSINHHSAETSAI